MKHTTIDSTLRESVRAIVRRAQANNQAGMRISRRHGQTTLGTSFGGLEKVAVWLNARPIPGKDSRLWRQDACGAHMYWHDYANTRSAWGWEVDHITPVSLGGTDDIENLQALHWRHNRRKGESVGKNYCIV